MATPRPQIIRIIWGLGVAMAIYLTAGVSGAHLNPAVTIALWLFACFERRKVLPFIVAQTAGAFCAAALVYGLYRQLFLDLEQSQHIVRGTAASLNRRQVDGHGDAKAPDNTDLPLTKAGPGDPQRSDAARAEENEQSGAKKLGHALPG